MNIKLSDYIANTIVSYGIKDVFMVTGGGAMHLNYAFGTHKDLTCTFNHHEQACAMAAEAYCRLSNRIAVVNVTSGPGGTNAITGVYGAWVDSIGMLVISGQVKYETTVRSTGVPLRQFGDQELDIEPLIKPITKYSQMVINPKTIRYHLEKAIYLAKNGRPGPCWLDIPLDVQASMINPDELISFNPSELDEKWKATDLDSNCEKIYQKLAISKRPVLFAGAGIRLSGQYEVFIKLATKLGIPVVTGFNAHDAIYNEHPCYIGRPSSLGDRAGNFAVQNADLLIILGSRLNMRQSSYNWASFSRASYKIWVDIDENEFKKPSINADLLILADLKYFLPKFLMCNENYQFNQHESWLAWCLERRNKYPVVLEEYWSNEKINPYCFMDLLFKNLPENQTIVTGNGSACVISFQAANIKNGQRLWTNSGCASMGYDLPAAIGASRALKDDESIICIAGDGSIMMNLQELQTISSNQIPIKIIILNNEGYVSIFQTQKNFFKGVEIGAGPKSGVELPSFEKISYGFNLPYFKCQKHNDITITLEKMMSQPGPCVMEVLIDENQPFSPKLSAKQMPDGKIISPPLEDLSPFLSREELMSNLLIEPYPEQ
jgi:acetolactate synthase I/II/III large subunit